MNLTVTQLPTGPRITIAIPGSISGPAGPPGTRTGQAVAWCVGFADTAAVIVDSYTLQLSAPYAATIVGVDLRVLTGSFSAAVLINGNPVVFTGGAVNCTVASPTKTFVAASSANVIAVGDWIVLVLSSPVGSPTGGVVGVNLAIT